MAFQMANMSQLHANTNGSVLATGVATAVGMQLNAGQQIHKIAFASGTTAAGTPTHWQFGVYSAATTPARLGVTADQLTAAWAANTLENLNVATTTLIPVTGWYWVAALVVATTVPTLLSSPAIASGLLSASGILPTQKALAITFGSALTTLPATITSPTTALTVPWCSVS